MDTGLLILRIVVGLLLAGHGAQKLLGWFGGSGLSGTGEFMESLGLRPGRPMALLAGLGEVIGGLLLGLGLLTPFGAMAVIGVLLTAVATAHADKGAWATNGGWELPLTYAAAASMLAFTGPGRFSVDAQAGWQLAGESWGVAALVVGLAGAGAVLVARAATQQLGEGTQQPA